MYARYVAVQIYTLIESVLCTCVVYACIFYSYRYHDGKFTRAISGNFREYKLNTRDFSNERNRAIFFRVQISRR